MDDPAYLRSVYDKATKSDVELTKEQLEVMKRIMQHEFPDAGFDPYQVIGYCLVPSKAHSVR
jgi:ribosome biogenesis protein ERB1